jgi:hypothetical protein
LIKIATCSQFKPSRVNVHVLKAADQGHRLISVSIEKSYLIGNEMLETRKDFNYDKTKCGAKNGNLETWS